MPTLVSFILDTSMCIFEYALHHHMLSRNNVAYVGILHVGTSVRNFVHMYM